MSYLQLLKIGENRRRWFFWSWTITDLFKALDCLPHELLIAKLHAHGIDISSLKLNESKE